MTATDPSRPTHAAALDLLRELGAGSVEHPGGNLLSHLRRTASMLDSWGATTALMLAGLCHAAYGTDGFPVALLGLDERARLQAVIGPEAEAIVHRYDACHRATTYARLGAVPLWMHDRFTGEATPLDPAEAADFAALTIANELDIVLHGHLGDDTVDEIADLIRVLARYAPSAAQRATDAIAAQRRRAESFRPPP